MCGLFIGLTKSKLKSGARRVLRKSERGNIRISIQNVHLLSSRTYIVAVVQMHIKSNIRVLLVEVFFAHIIQVHLCSM